VRSFRFSESYTCIFIADGLSQIDDYKLDTEQLIADTIIVVDYLIAKYPIPSIIIVGHSMGGAIAAKTTERLLESGKYGDKL
jgi:alpha-beta hydrolase superfamily lysophospholipase